MGIVFALTVLVSAPGLPRGAILGVAAGVAKEGGTTVDRVLPDSTAQALGVKPGDVVLSINETRTPAGCVLHSGSLLRVHR